MCNYLLILPLVFSLTIFIGLLAYNLLSRFRARTRLVVTALASGVCAAIWASFWFTEVGWQFFGITFTAAGLFPTLAMTVALSLIFGAVAGLAIALGVNFLKTERTLVKTGRALLLIAGGLDLLLLATYGSLCLVILRIKG
jgi:hypothetical protein